MNDELKTPEEEGFFDKMKDKLSDAWEKTKESAEEAWDAVKDGGDNDDEEVIPPVHTDSTTVSAANPVIDYGAADAGFLAKDAYIEPEESTSNAPVDTNESVEYDTEDDIDFTPDFDADLEDEDIDKDY